MPLKILRVGDTPIVEPLRRAAEQVDSSDVERSIVELARTFPSGWPIGLEAALLRCNLSPVDLPELKLKHPIARQIRLRSSGNVDHLLARPPSEIAARQLWRDLASDSVNVEGLRFMARLLGGSECIRQGEATTAPFSSGQVIQYANAACVAGRLASLLEGLKCPSGSLPPLLAAIGVLFEFLILHPFQDGNGRLARLLFQGALHQSIGLSLPVAPLGPAFGRNRARVIAAFHAWYFDRDATPLARFVLGALEQVVLASTSTLKRLQT